jgi:hypothetical protein
VRPQPAAAVPLFADAARVAAAAAAAQYGQGVFAPGIPMGDEGMYKCGHNLLRAHAKTFELYHKVITLRTIHMTMLLPL